MATTTPTDGRLTSFPTLTGGLAGSEVMYIVSPGNAQLGNSYQIALSTLAVFFAQPTGFTQAIITSGATIGSPYNVLTTDNRVLFNKTVSAASYALLPPSATMLSATQSVLFKDLKGDAYNNPITITFSSGERCDNLTQIVINTAYGWARLMPSPVANGWYQSS